jgi:hypothetical protein
VNFTCDVHFSLWWPSHYCITPRIHKYTQLLDVNLKDMGKILLLASKRYINLYVLCGPDLTH